MENQLTQNAIYLDKIICLGKTAVLLTFYPSFRRMPESRMSLKSLDSGLRRNDGRGYWLFMSQIMLHLMKNKQLRPRRKMSAGQKCLGNKGYLT